MANKILIVDDDLLTMRAAARGLKMKGWDVCKSNTPPGPGYLPACGFDVVLADWDPYGPAVLQLAKEAGVPAVVYTGAPEALPALDVPALAKPYDLDELDQVLRAQVAAAAHDPLCGLEGVPCPECARTPTAEEEEQYQREYDAFSAEVHGTAQAGTLKEAVALLQKENAMQQLIAAAAQAQEEFGDDELEAFAAAERKAEKAADYAGLQGKERLEYLAACRKARRRP